MSFEKNIFVNCPYDDDYRQILLGIIYTVMHFGFNPRLSLERADSAESRIDKIVGLIQESKFGIHDLSRMVSSYSDEHFRMNMPFELGIDFGCKKFKGGKWSTKKLLVLEEKKYRYQSSISDLSGSDIKSHNNEVIEAVSSVRDWLITEELGRGHSSNVVWDGFNDFNAFLYDQVVVSDGHESIDDVQIPEVIHHMQSWFKLTKNV